MEKIHINNSRFMEFIDEMATQITEMNFGADTYAVMMFTEEAQDYYNEVYDEYEAMANNVMGVYSDNELTLQDER
tara:strand:- start:62 stop:286 length:225 start_codon:yes stop_codon:yes gene_type:complete